jgi:FkbM family methyltransferase
VLKEINFEPAFILDIGAYRGQWSKQVRQIYPNVKMVMFEAQESKMEELLKIKMEVEPCELFITLLGSETRENVVFYEMETGSSIYEENTNYERTIRHKKMKKLDDFDLKFDLFSGGFLKLDVQGSEIDVIRGAKKIIERTDVVLMEMNLLNYNEGAPALNVVIQELDNLGFSVFDICDEHRTHQGILFQINLFSLLGYYSPQVKKTAEFLIENKMVHMIGSDCHGQRHLPVFNDAINSYNYQRICALPLINNNL